MNSSTTFAFLPNVDSDENEIVSFDGRRIDISCREWRLGPDSVINWATLPTLGVQVFDAVKAYLKHSIRSVAPTTAERRFKDLKNFFQAATDINVDLSTADSLGVQLLKRVRTHLAEQQAVATVVGALHTFRFWYLWSTDVNLQGFDFEVAVGLENLVIGGAPKGEAVLSNDPKRGPLHSAEFERMYQAMRQAADSPLIPDMDLAAVWLFMSLGCNPRSLQLLNEKDLLCTEMADGTVKYEIRIPRIKKPGLPERSQFRTRPLRQEVGRLLARVVASNRAARALLSPYYSDRRFATPIFRTPEPREYLGRAFESEMFRWPRLRFGEALTRISYLLNLRGRDGGPLHITARRLRYTFATRLVQDGASPVVLADALDHTDLQHVMVYYNARSDIVVRLDKTTAAKLAPWGQAFMGAIVPTESLATRGDDPASRIRHLDQRRGKLEGIGTCGRFDPCGLMAPIACYTCRKFQAWREAPHELVLDALLEDRDQHLQRGADPKMTQARDLTISAVTWVVERCREMLADGSNAGE